MGAVVDALKRYARTPAYRLKVTFKTLGIDVFQWLLDDPSSTLAMFVDRFTTTGKGPSLQHFNSHTDFTRYVAMCNALVQGRVRSNELRRRMGNRFKALLSTHAKATYRKVHLTNDSHVSH